MNDCTIRVTRRQGDTETMLEIDCGSAPQKSSIDAVISVGAVTHALWGFDRDTGLEWSQTLCDGERVNHAAAEKACAALGDGWRLPTRAELLSLVDDTRCDPAIDVERFPDTKSGAYWTSTPYASDSSYAWIVLFYYGSAGNYRRDNGDAFVRAVRSLPAGQ